MVKATLQVFTCTHRINALQFEYPENAVRTANWIRLVTDNELKFFTTDDGKYLYYRNEDGNNYLERIIL
jgi:hypothetical protein